ncbi:hypothetical protein N836_13595 [Leptolyngbya sp. Heron Island J]|uniref:hypothetical protein n=1 Tax=Leptolyngbya sp. Heron Island J TaxID=1385935 RepID=UPI0003B980D8|nr:hypothetical protein [Leptolyngbya sp. Heron Island J]ESA35094.1 hypothetical protein N836_13595 [Leptolyngbya sp. Heron Island J]
MDHPDHPKEISCRAILENLIKTYGLAHTLSALEYLVGDLNLPDGTGTAQILNEFGLSTLIEVTADLEGVAGEIGWLQEIREEESEL